MRYTQQQSLAILGVDQSTFVYWMRTVPRIERLKGRGCHFERRDLLALGVISEITRNLGVSIAALQPTVPKIFELFQDVRVGELGRMALVLEDNSVRLEPLPVSTYGPGPVAILPMKTLADRVLAPERSADLLPLELLMQPATKSSTNQHRD